MRRLVFLFLFLAASSVQAQPIEPKPPTPQPTAIKSKIVPAQPKAGNLLLIDASAAGGNVKFKHEFPAGTFFIDGKKLVVAIPAATKDTKTWNVWVIYFKEEADETVTFKVPGTDDPNPVEPGEKDIASLTAAVNSLTKAVNVQGGMLAQFDARIAALEKNPPKPPDPNPPGPVVADNLRVMIIYETSSPLPSAQQSILTSKAVRDYLIKKTVPTADGLKRGWYIVDKDTDFSSESPFWRDNLARPRTSIPWIIISNSKTGFEGPLPANVDDTLTLLKKFGG